MQKTLWNEDDLYEENVEKAGDSILEKSRREKMERTMDKNNIFLDIKVEML